MTAATSARMTAARRVACGRGHRATPARDPVHQPENGHSQEPDPGVIPENAAEQPGAACRIDS
jgi:hypothetical protein